MRIANHMGGFSLNEADTLRKAMGKKKREIMEEYKAKFVDGAVAGNVDRDLARRIFDLIEFFAGYGFNKSHSTAYALVTYQTAYLKANYPTEFMAAVMSCEMNNTDKIVEYLNELKPMGIEILPPDINQSEGGFSVEEKCIRYGMEAIKGLGAKAVEAIVRRREAGGEFKSIFDVCDRVEKQQGLNKSTLEILTSSMDPSKKLPANAP